jgi:hypothetical protein
MSVLLHASSNYLRQIVSTQVQTAKGHFLKIDTNIILEIFLHLKTSIMSPRDCLEVMFTSQIRAYLK